MNQAGKKQKIKAAAFMLGILLFLLSLLPSFLLGADGFIVVHDQLDGEVPAYILTAKHLRDNSVPEFLNGDSNRESLTPASWGTLLFYLAFQPFTAFLLNEAFIRIAAFLGMYLLLRKWKVSEWAAYLSAFLFSLLNFYSVYGLAVMGQPLLLYGYLQAKDRKAGVVPYTAALLFAAFSSPVLAGFADVIVLTGALVILAIRRKPGVKQTALFLLVLLVTWGILYRHLIMQVFGGAAFVSHRTEWVRKQAETWKDQFVTTFRDGYYHAASEQTDLVPWILAAGTVGLLLYDQWDAERKQTIRRLWTLLAGAAAAAFLYAAWRSEPVISWRLRLGGVFESFRFERVFWLNPLFWWGAFGLTAKLMSETVMLPKIGGVARGLLSKAVSLALAVVFMASAAVAVYHASPLRQNLIRLSEGVKETDESFRSFYSEELFRQIDSYIGRPKDSYRVGSIGLYPSVPLVNGFYCIDGYSNNYDVEYKHAFREAISGELEKSSSIRTYFDEWGNRCYLFSAELGKKYYFTRDKTKTIKSLNLDAEALRRLGCEYILSGVKIKNAGETGLKLLETFQGDGSPYIIRLYQVESSREKPDEG